MACPAYTRSIADIHTLAHTQHRSAEWIVNIDENADGYERKRETDRMRGFNIINTHGSYICINGTTGWRIANAVHHWIPWDSAEGHSRFTFLDEGHRWPILTACNNHDHRSAADLSTPLMRPHWHLIRSLVPMLLQKTGLNEVWTLSMDIVLIRPFVGTLCLSMHINIHQLQIAEKNTRLSSELNDLYTHTHLIQWPIYTKYKSINSLEYNNNNNNKLSYTHMAWAERAEEGANDERPKHFCTNRMKRKKKLNPTTPNTCKCSARVCACLCTEERKMRGP